MIYKSLVALRAAWFYGSELLAEGWKLITFPFRRTLANRHQGR